MKNRLLPLFFVLGIYSAHSQVAVGKIEVNPSTQLEVFAADKGVLIPQVKLKSSTDATTITHGNVNSLLVFNTETISDVTPGYYYWYVDKWRRMTNSDEVKNGIAGGQGAPGTPGVNIPDDAMFYVDTTTKIVYVLEPNSDPQNWISVNGKNGLDGKNGVYGGDGVPGAQGTPGIDATVEMYVDYNTGIVYVRDPKDHDKWVSINGLNGLDGKNGVFGGDGVPGEAGSPGIDGTIEMYVDYKTGIVYVRDPKDHNKWVSLNGKNGLDGNNGIFGGDGAPGEPGSPGIDGTIEMYVDYKTGIVYVRDPEDHNKWVSLNGKNGNNGKDGIGGGKGAPGEPGTPAVDPVIQFYIDYDSKTIYIRDPENPDKWIPVNKPETVTVLENKGAGLYTYTNEAGTPVNITVIEDVADNFQTIVNNPAVTEIIKNIVKKTDGNVTYNATTQTFSYTDAAGDSHVINISDLVKLNETETTLTNNGGGSYTYKNEKGVEVGITVVEDVADNFQTIVNNPAVTEIIKNIVKKTDGNVTYNATTQAFSYTDTAGDSHVINISDLVKLNETETTLTNNGGGSYTYKNEKGVEVGITVVEDVADNFQTIVNNPAVTEIIKNIVKKTDGNVTYNSTTQTFSYTDAAGDSHVINISDLVKLNETETTLTNNGGGSYTYKNEKGVEVGITVVEDVADNFQTIVNNPAVTEIIKNIVKKTDGNVTYNAATQTFSYTDAAGDSHVINISDLVKLNETETTLTNNGGGSYTYKNEKGVEVGITVVEDVADNFQTIVNNPAVTEIIKNIVKKTDGNVTYNATTKKFSYTDASGVSHEIDISEMVKLNETVTTLENKGAGLYTYKNEAGTSVNITVVGDVANNFQTIVDSPGVTEIIKNIVKNTDGNVTYNAVTKKFSYTDASGVSHEIDISEMVKLNETLTTLENKGAGLYTYKNEVGTSVNITVVGDVANNFQTIVDSPGVTEIIKNIVKKTDGNVTYNAVTKKFSYTDASGVSHEIDISEMVKLNETVTTLAFDAATSKLTYTNETAVPNVITLSGLKDNLGNHTATQDLNMSSNNIANAGTVSAVNANVTTKTITETAAIKKGTDGSLPAVGLVATAADANGNIIWSNPSILVNGDNLGNHIATQDLNMNTKNIANAGTVTAVNGNITTKITAGTAAITKGTDGSVPAAGSIATSLDANGNVVWKPVSSVVVGTASVSSPKATVTVTGANTVLGATSIDIKPGTANTVMTTNATGDVAWIPVSTLPVIGDNLGNHTATQDLNMNTKNITNAANVAVTAKTTTETAAITRGTDGSLPAAGSIATSLDANGNVVWKPVSSVVIGTASVSSPKATVNVTGTNTVLGATSIDIKPGTANTVMTTNAAGDVTWAAASTIGTPEPWNKVGTTTGATLNTDDMYTQGWVGIGFNTPSGAANEKLRVNGAITTVNSYYADYVFEDYFKGFSDIKADYKFKSLVDVDAYIKANKHLPGITPISKLAKTNEGYAFNISELSIQLLEKTEELYLHVIEQEKDLETKNNEIQVLKTALETTNARLEKLEKLVLEKK